MPEFDLDNFKETWQNQPVTPRYDSKEIESMLNKSSRNYVKYILWISLVEFALILGANLYYTYLGEDNTDLMSILGKLGINVYCKSSSSKKPFSYLSWQISS